MSDSDENRQAKKSRTVEIFDLEIRKSWLTLGAFALFILFSGICFRGCCVKFVDNYELGYRYDRRDGTITLVGRTGYVLYPPIVVDIHTVDMRPMQVCINANARVLNCKLVQFDANGLETFLNWHGRADYDAPTSSGGGDATSSTTTHTTQFSNILMSYAFDGSGKNYPFLKVIRELKPEEAASPTAMASAMSAIPIHPPVAASPASSAGVGP